MNLVQMLVLQLENRNTSVLVHALLLILFCFGSIYFFLVGLRYQRNSFYHFLADETTGMDSCIYAVSDDVDVAEAYKEAHKRQEEG